jgi:hypothetical protein
MCGAAASGNASTCINCGASLLPLPTVSTPRNDQLRLRRWAVGITVLFGAIGIVWDVLAAAILFRSYSFFEAVVVCLLVMILCAVATLRADFELWSGIFGKPDTAKEGDDDNRKALDQIRSHLRVLFYGIAFLMALVKLVLTLIA